MLPGWCCIAIAALEQGNGDSWYHMCAFRFHFWGRKVNWNQASHVRASSVPTLYACCLTKRSCHFLFVARVGLCCWFCDFAVSFLVPPDGPKNETVPKMRPWKSFSFVFLLSGACGPKNGTMFRFIFWSLLYQGCRSATFWFQWSFVAYGGRKGN